MATSFTSPLLLEFLDNQKWKLTAGFEYYLDTKKDIVFKVPKGFITDFASVPRFLWWLLSPIEDYGKAAVLHDYLYYSGQYSRKFCDDILMEAMKVLNVKRWHRILVYIGVRIGGWFAWHKHRKNDKKKEKQL